MIRASIFLNIVKIKEDSVNIDVCLFLSSLISGNKKNNSASPNNLYFTRQICRSFCLHQPHPSPVLGQDRQNEMNS